MKKQIDRTNIKSRFYILKQLEDGKYNWETLNQYSCYMNELIDKIDDSTIDKVKTLTKDDGAFGGGTSTTERAVLNELLIKYEELLNYLSSNRFTLFQELKSSTKVFKLVNAGALLGVASLFFSLGYNYPSTDSAPSKNIQLEKTDLTYNPEHYILLSTKEYVRNIEDSIKLKISLENEEKTNQILKERELLLIEENKIMKISLEKKVKEIQNLKARASPTEIQTNPRRQGVTGKWVE